MIRNILNTVEYVSLDTSSGFEVMRLLKILIICPLWSVHELP